MKSELEFYDYESKQPSDCGSVLAIEFSAADSGWVDVVLEKGTSPHFYPNNVYTPYFYFALALDKELHWQVDTDQGLTALKTVPGNIWINPPLTPFTHDISEPCHFIILAVKEQLFLESCSLNLKGKTLQFLNNYNVEDDVIKGIIELFMLEARGGGRNGVSYLQNLLGLLSTHYIQSYSNYTDLQNAQLSASKFDQQQLERIDHYIVKHCSQTITIEALADLLHCSKFYFLREFKKLVGITPYQYLLNKRMEMAQQQLSKPDASIAVVASELGFNDQSHFSRTFKKEFGITPGQYLKQR